MLWRVAYAVYDVCWRTWYTIHVEHKGAYSMERLQMVHHFLAKQKSSVVSFFLDLVVTVGTPLPCLAIALVSDAIPLAPPEDGPRANGMFWARSWLIMTSFTLAVLLPMHHPCIAPIPERRVLLYLLSVGISAVYTSVYFAVALAIGFPVPFSYLTLNIVWMSLIIGGLWVYMGSACRASKLVRQRLKLHAIFIYAASSLAVVYPLFYYSFLQAREYVSAQLLLSFVLPIIKMMEKQLLYHTTFHASDMQPVFIAFNVEVFNALFVSSCMRSATSISVTIALMAADFIGACAALYGLGNIMVHVDELGVKMGSETTRTQMVPIAAFIAKHHHSNNLDIENNGAESPRCGKNVSDVTSWVAGDACDMGEVGSTNHKDSMLYTVNHRNSTIDPPRSPLKIAWEQKIMSPKQNAIVPAEIALPSAFYRGPSTEIMASSVVYIQMIKHLSLEERQHFVHETCRILRRVEFLLLVEYTEVMVPIVYVIYIATVYHLPNRKYFPYLNEMSDDDLTSTIRSVLIYGALQFVSLIILLDVLNRRFRLAPGAILRFVLHNEWRVVQGQFVLWIIYVLQSSIQHVGTDYTFKFRWLHKD